ncbi:MAG TPA: RibD family protein [Caulobacteraceae bacterium]|nr:RibD family protein [Caulobacteraceae bacterium]
MSAPRGVTLKLATSLDGRIATATGESRWITGERSRRTVHELRAGHDAVIVGVDTALIDDPALTVRLDGHESAQPARVVLDSRQRLPADSQLARTARQIPTWVVTTGAPRAALIDLGVRVIQVDADADGRPAPAAALQALAQAGLNAVMIEGGGRVAASFLSAGLVDRIEWFRAPILLGADGLPAVGALALRRLADAPSFRRTDARESGADLWERYERV